MVNQSSDFPVRRTGSYRHKKALLRCMTVCVCTELYVLLPLWRNKNIIMVACRDSNVDICSRGAELAVHESQQRRWDDGQRHSQLQSALSSAGTDEWVLNIGPYYA